MKKYALDKLYGTIIFQCITKKQDSKLCDDLADHFLLCLNKANNYKDKKRFAYYLGCLTDYCSLAVQKVILTFFLNSGKRYLRKYAYPKNLAELGLFQLAWKQVNENTGEATFLLKTVAYHYSLNFIEKNFDKLIAHTDIEEYQIRKLFMRHSSLNKEKWLWLKSCCPNSFLYLASTKNYPVSDNDCLKIYQENKKNNCEDPYSESAPPMLLLWCLARMGKWIVIKEILDEQKPT